MLKLIGFSTSIFLVVIILLRVPQESRGLAKSNFLGSSRTTERFLNILTSLGILIYFGIAIKLNLIT